MNTENNVLLADFLGFQKTDLGWFDNEGVLSEIEQDNCFDSLYLLTDWNWLMAVVLKIESLKYFFNSGPFIDDSTQELTGEYWCAINQLSSNLKPENFIDVCGCDSKLKATYKACIEFVKWFNQQNNEK